MSIYKWWPSRLALLIDAYLRHAAQLLPLPEHGNPVQVLRAHVSAYARALGEDLGRVQLAVVAECLAHTGSAHLFSERYLSHRRARLLDIIQRGQRDGAITATEDAGDLYDRIYGTLFYQYVFGFGQLSAPYARRLVDAVLRPQA